MDDPAEAFDAVVIGGGFYGTAIAIHLARHRGVERVALVERESGLFGRASTNNQARVHNGYHYPRSFVTAYRSRVNLPRFVRDWPAAIRKDFTCVYAIARRNSKVTARQFRRFCHEIGATLEAADASIAGLFARPLVEDVFVAEEYAFDARALAASAADEMDELGVRTLVDTEVRAIRHDGKRLRVEIDAAGSERALTCRLAFNCTYSGINRIGGDFPGTRTPVKHEITELALMSMPEELRGLGITMMDGPFFSLMPFPPRDLHTLSHVRYTPHRHWIDSRGIDPYRALAEGDRSSRVDRMVRDVERYLPCIAGSRHVDSNFEVKTVLQKSESDDGRPILFESHASLPGCHSILGGKIDNIYDVLERLGSLDVS